MLIARLKGAAGMLRRSADELEKLAYTDRKELENAAGK